MKSLGINKMNPFFLTFSSQLFVREPVAACLPLLPLIFPAWWIIINSAALANVLTLFRQVRLLALLLIKVSDVIFL